MCTCCYSIFICSTSRIKVCKIRFVSNSENHGKLCLVHKKFRRCMTIWLVVISSTIKSVVVKMVSNLGYLHNNILRIFLYSGICQFLYVSLYKLNIRLFVSELLHMVGDIFLCHSKLNKMSHVMRKPVLAIYEQQRRRSACTSAQSDQHLCCSLLG